ncbi:MAG TPA: hypothetical protein VID27_18550 [Blastocatellia bacterium]
MRKPALLILIFALTFAAAPIAGSASDDDRTLLIRVKAADAKNPVTFSVSYWAEANQEPVELENQSTPFETSINGNTLNATFRKEAGESKMYVEVIQFRGKRQVATVKGDGTKVEIESQSDGDGSRMTVHSFE